MPLKDQFEQFVASQPAERVIRHSSWSACAIGEFTRNYNSNLTVADRLTVDDVVTALATEYGVNVYSFESVSATSEVPTVMDSLCMGGASFYYLDERWIAGDTVIVTYGDLQHALTGKLSWIS